MSSSLIALSNDLTAAVERAGKSVVAVRARSRVPSSGVIFPGGLIVTTDHAVERDDGIPVTYPNGQTVTANLVGRDPGTDLAVFRTSTGASDHALKDNSDAKVGSLVLAVGRSPSAGIHASMGIVSQVSGPWHTWRGGSIDRMIRLDLRLHPGVSGGALVDSAGSLIGIVTGGLSRSSPIAIPLATIERVTRELVEQGRVRRPYFGVGFQPIALPKQLIESLKLDDARGLIVVSTEPGSPADQAGILLGDIITSINGQPVEDVRDVMAVLSSLKIGSSVPLKLVRGGQSLELKATVGERPQESRE